MVASGEGWGGMDWEFGISRCKLLYREWINNKVLLYSTGNYIQYLVINYNGKEKKKNSKDVRGPRSQSSSGPHQSFISFTPRKSLDREFWCPCSEMGSVIATSKG